MSTYKKILVPIDFSDHSERTIDHAHELADKSVSTRAQIHLLHVVGLAKQIVLNGL